MHSPPPISLDRADGDDIFRIRALLEENGLPYEDVRTPQERRDSERTSRFFLAYAEGECIGTGGIEVHGSVGLLRSVLVTESNRGRGYGTALCTALEEDAATNGVETLYLLTTTASEFFGREGYEPIAREHVPSSIRQTAEFVDLCPDSATCMEKPIR